MKNHMMIGMISVLIALGVAAVPAACQELEADTSLVTAYSPDVDKGLPEQPYCAQFKKDDKRFSFIAAIHGTDKATYRLIEQEIRLLKPNVVVIEGTLTFDGLNPQEKIELMNKEKLWEKTEAFYAAKLALDNDIPFIGGEPLNRDIREVILRNFAIEDLAAFYCLRGITAKPKATFETASATFSSVAAGFGQEFDYPCPFASFAQIQAWFKKCHGRDMAEKDLTPDLVMPRTGDEALVSQKVSAEVGRVRDIHLVQVIAQMVSEHKKVVLIYGGSHFATDHRSIEAMLGKPKFVK